MAGDPDPPRAWSFLRCDPAYRAAWRDQAAPPAYERDTPFPVRVQAAADRAAVTDWSLLAWQDPLAKAGPLSAFFSDVPMLDGTGSASAAPLLPLLARAGATIEGLRLMNGVLILKVERDGRAIQVRVTDAGPLLAGGGVRVWHDWGLRLPMNIAQLTDLWSVSGGPSPRSGVGGRVRGGTATTRC